MSNFPVLQGKLEPPTLKWKLILLLSVGFFKALGPSSGTSAKKLLKNQIVWVLS